MGRAFQFLASAIRGTFGLLLFAGALIGLGQAIFDGMSANQGWDSLPDSLSATVTGLMLAGFMSFPLSFILMAVAGIALKRDVEAIGMALGVSVLSLICGGILVFVVPLWIAGAATALALTYTVYAIRSLARGP